MAKPVFVANKISVRPDRFVRRSTALIKAVSTWFTPLASTRIASPLLWPLKYQRFDDLRNLATNGIGRVLGGTGSGGISRMSDINAPAPAAPDQHVQGWRFEVMPSAYSTGSTYLGNTPSGVRKFGAFTKGGIGVEMR